MARCARLPLSGFAGLLYGKACHTILRSLCSLTNRVPLPPLFRGQNKTPRNALFISISTVSTGCCAPSKRGKGGGASHQRGNAFPRPQGGCMVFAAKGGIKNGAEGAVPPQWNGTSYLPRAEPSTRPGGVSRSRTEPLAPRAERPGGAINPRGKAASTFGNTGKQRPGPDPDRATGVHQLTKKAPVSAGAFLL